jgi:hypothetical protein
MRYLLGNVRYTHVTTVGNTIVVSNLKAQAPVL